MPKNSLSQSKVRTELLTLQTIFNGDYQFTIPSYQRPYVWSDDDVLDLFNDIKTACKLKEPNYFIGTILSSEQSWNGDKVYELIDGQQRTTTLMLMTIAFKQVGVKTDLSNLAVYGNKPRLQFTVRDQVQQLLGAYAKLEGFQEPSGYEIENNPYLSQIEKALVVLKKAVQKVIDTGGCDDEPTINKLGEYLYSNVQWVNNIVPLGTDLNRLFSTMNTSGIQLEQTDILKAKLFKKITTNKARYDAMWVACEHLESYFERNVQKVFKNGDWARISPPGLASFNNELLRFEAANEAPNSTQKRKGLSIAELASGLMEEENVSTTDSRSFETYDLDVETVYCESIIKFPLLLIHAYRVYLALNGGGDIEPRLHSDRLLEIFEPLVQSDEETITGFIKMLWQVRYQFDRWVIKKVEPDNSTQTQLALTSQTKSKDRINRSQKELSALVLLQSVRNFTGDRSAQYWLTPFIARLLAENISDESAALSLLEGIDNCMSLSKVTQKEASFLLAKNIEPMATKWHVKRSYFYKPLHTSFEHYWFQKLEYLLWKQLKKSELGFNTEHQKKFKLFRITSKNSVEHIHPQNHSKLASEHLHHFGNLVLLSPGENSSYSDKPESVKRAEFMKKDRYDSLKSKRIFEQMKDGGDWRADDVETHCEEMLAVLDTHYEEGSLSNG